MDKLKFGNVANYCLFLGGRRGLEVTRARRLGDPGLNLGLAKSTLQILQIFFSLHEIRGCLTVSRQRERLISSGSGQLVLRISSNNNNVRCN